MSRIKPATELLLASYKVAQGVTELRGARLDRAVAAFDAWREGDLISSEREYAEKLSLLRDAADRLLNLHAGEMQARRAELSAALDDTLARCAFLSQEVRKDFRYPLPGRHMKTPAAASPGADAAAVTAQAPARIIRDPSDGSIIETATFEDVRRTHDNETKDENQAQPAIV